MIAYDLISDIIPPLKTSDTGTIALNWMNEFQVKHLPIVNNEQFLGLVSEDDLLGETNPEKPIGNYKLSYFKPYVLETDHIYRVLNVAAQMELTLVPVVDEEMNYKGVVSIQSLMNHFATMSSVTERGGIIVIESEVRDYSLTEISRIIESNDAKVLSIYTYSIPDSNHIEITIKLNREDLSDIIAAFNRFDYKVLAYFHKSDSEEDLKDRFDHFIRYMNI